MAEDEGRDKDGICICAPSGSMYLGICVAWAEILGPSNPSFSKLYSVLALDCTLGTHFAFRREASRKPPWLMTSATVCMIC